MKIDSHQHFWKFDPIRDSWINNEMSVIQRDFMPADLKPVLEQNGLEGCIAVQADQTEAQNSFLLELAECNDFIKGVVGWVDLQSPDIEQRLQYYAKMPKMKGFRHVLQGEPQRDFMLRPAFLNGIGLLHRYNFTYDILIFPDQLAFAEEMVKAFSDQRFVVDHIAKPDIKNRVTDVWKKRISALASHQNVYCKVSGMVTEADWKHWKADDFTPYLDTIFEAFGTNRVMFGSDWPVCLVAGGYEQMLNIVKKYTSTLSSHERSLFWGGNAVKFYNLNIE